MPHSHDCQHAHGGDSHLDPNELGVQYSLYTKIDIDNVVCLNEAEEGSGKYVFKPWSERLNSDKYVESDVDEELLFNIPFTGNVKLKGIIILGGEGDSHPSAVKLFKNRGQMTFDDVAAEADQEFELTPDMQGIVEYPIKIAKFSTVHQLSIYFPKNFGAEVSRVYYIGLKGEFTEAQRDAILITNYELAPNPADHKVSQIDSVTQQIH